MHRFRLWILNVLICVPLVMAQGSPPSMTSSTVRALTAVDGETFDAAFIASALEYVDGAYQLVQEELVVSQRPQVKRLADQLFDQLSTDRKTLEQRLKETKITTDAKWRGLMREDQRAVVAYGLGRIVAGHDMNMSPDKDRSFLESMIQHHEGGLALWKLGIGRAVQPELRRFVENQLEMQEKAIGVYRSMLGQL